MYCGNNALDEKLLSGELALGTRYECMKRGVGAGLNAPARRRGAYQKLVEDKFYCGNKNILPAGYDRFGTLPDCVSKGFGVGQKIAAERAFGTPDYSDEEEKINYPDGYMPLYDDEDESGEDYGRDYERSERNPNAFSVYVRDRTNFVFSNKTRLFLWLTFYTEVLILFCLIFEPEFLLEEVEGENIKKVNLYKAFIFSIAVAFVLLIIGILMKL